VSEAQRGRSAATKAVSVAAALMAQLVLGSPRDLTIPAAASGIPSGAKCDGATDDAAAIQRAIDLGSVDLPAGATCVVAKAIAIPSNRAIVGHGATLKLKSGASDHVLKNADLTGGNTNIRVQGLVIDHNGAATGGNTIAILLNNVTHSTVTDNTILNARVHAVELANGSTDNVVSRNLIDTFGSSSIGTGITAFRGSQRNTIAGKHHSQRCRRHLRHSDRRCERRRCGLATFQS